MCRALEKNYEVIRAEYDAYLQRLRERKMWDDTDTTPGLGSVGGRPGAIHDGGLRKSGDWLEVPLLVNGGVNTEFTSLFPKTFGVLFDSCKDAVGLSACMGGDVIFSVLTPGTRLRPHCGPSNSRLTCHMGIHIPQTAEEGCWLRVANGPRRGWEEGKCIVFDDSFEHEVHFEAPKSGQCLEPRVVLLLNFWHPDFEFKNDEQWRAKSDEMMANIDVESLPKTAIMKVGA